MGSIEAPSATGGGSSSSSAGSSRGNGDDGRGGHVSTSSVWTGVIRLSGDNRIYGSAAVRKACPQQADAAVLSGQPQRQRVRSKSADGDMYTHVLSVVSRLPYSSVFFSGAATLVQELGVQPGDRLALWAWPDESVVITAYHNTVPAFTLNASAVSSSSGSSEGGHSIDVPLGVAERLLGADLARGLTSSVAVPVIGLGPPGAGVGGGLGGRLQGTADAHGPRWQLVGLQTWLRGVGAAPGDCLQLGLKECGGVRSCTAALTVALVRAADAVDIYTCEGEGVGAGPAPNDLIGAVRVSHLLRKGRHGALQGLKALRRAFPQQVAAAQAGGKCAVVVYGNCPDGAINRYKATLTRRAGTVLLRGVRSLAHDLGLQPGGTVVLWLLPGGHVVAEAAEC